MQLVIARRRLDHQPQSRAGEGQEQHGDGQPPILCRHRPQPQPTQRHHERGGVGRQRQIEPQPVVPLRAGDPPEIGDERRHRQIAHGPEDRRRERDQIVVDRRKTGSRGEIGIERQRDQQRAGGDDQLGSHDRHEARLPGEAVVAGPAQLVERDGEAETEGRIPAEIEAQQRGQPQRQTRRKEPAPPPGSQIARQRQRRQQDRGRGREGRVGIEADRAEPEGHEEEWDEGHPARGHVPRQQVDLDGQQEAQERVQQPSGEHGRLDDREQGRQRIEVTRPVHRPEIAIRQLAVADALGVDEHQPLVVQVGGRFELAEEEEEPHNKDCAEQ